MRATGANVVAPLQTARRHERRTAQRHRSPPPSRADARSTPSLAAADDAAQAGGGLRALADAANPATVATVMPCPSPARLERWSRSDLGEARERGRRLRQQPEGVRKSFATPAPPE